MTRQDIDRYLENGIITAREHEVLRHRLTGFSQYEIARGLGLSRSAINTRERNALDKIARHLQEDAA